MNWLSLKDDQLKFKTSRKLPIVLEEIYGMNLKLAKETWNITTYNQLDLETIWTILTDTAQKSPRALSIYFILKVSTIECDNA